MQIDAVCNAIAVNATKLANAPRVINRHRDHSIAKSALAVNMHCVARFKRSRARWVDHLDSKCRHTDCQHVAFLSCHGPSLRSGRRIEDHQFLSLLRRLCISNATCNCLTQPRHTALHYAQRITAHLAKLLAGVVIHLFDGATRKNVVKLIQEHRLPRAVKRHARCLRTRCIAGHTSARARQRLAKPQHAFRATIRFLDPCLTGVGTAMQLQIELTVPYLDVLAIAPQRALRLV